jgi:hypothetical protein
VLVVLVGCSVAACRTSAPNDSWIHVEGLRAYPCALTPVAAPAFRVASTADVRPSTLGRLVVRIATTDSVRDPRPSANVALSGVRGFALSERFAATGVIVFDSLPAGSYTVTARRLGYHRIQTPATVRRGYADTIELQFDGLC